MATDWYNTGMLEIINGTINLSTTTLSLILVNDNYVFDADHDVLDNGADDGTDPSFCELSATNYARKNITGLLTFVLDKEDGEVRVNVPDQVYALLGGDSNDDIAAAIIVAGAGADTAKRLIAHIDLRDSGAPVTTTGQDTVIDFRDDEAGGTLLVYRSASA